MIFSSFFFKKIFVEVCISLTHLISHISIIHSHPNHPLASAIAFQGFEPHKVDYPAPWADRLDTFRRLVMIRCLRPDKLTPAVRDFVRVSLGERFTEPPPFDLAGAYDDSTPATPLLFVLSPGSGAFSHTLTQHSYNTHSSSEIEKCESIISVLF